MSNLSSGVPNPTSASGSVPPTVAPGATNWVVGPPSVPAPPGAVPVVPTPAPAVPAVPSLPSLPVKYLHWIAFAIGVLNLVLYLTSGGKAPQVPDVPVVPAMQTPPEQAPPPPNKLAMGWVNDPEARETSFVRMSPNPFAQTSAGKAVMGDIPDTFLWRAVRKACGKDPLAKWYPNLNQLDVGCCPGTGWAHTVDASAASQTIVKGDTFALFSPEVIYAGSRVTIGKGQIRGDGSVGAWCREWVSTYGVAPMAKYQSADLTTFDPHRARTWGAPRAGVPADIVAVAKQHPCGGTAQVSTWADVQKSIAQGYAVAVCSDVGFNAPNGDIGVRDANGFIAPRGSWPHCMSIIGIRGGDKPGGFILNSWGDDAMKGPVWPDDAPPAGFWVDSNTIERMVSQGDSFAVATVAGFEARPLDWFTSLQGRGDTYVRRPSTWDLLTRTGGLCDAIALLAH